MLADCRARAHHVMMVCRRAGAGYMQKSVRRVALSGGDGDAGDSRKVTIVRFSRPNEKTHIHLRDSGSHSGGDPQHISRPNPGRWVSHIHVLL